MQSSWLQLHTDFVFLTSTIRFLDCGQGYTWSMMSRRREISEAVSKNRKTWIMDRQRGMNSPFLTISKIAPCSFLLYRTDDKTARNHFERSQGELPP